MWTIPNILTLLRFPLALLFIPNSTGIRVAVLLLAMASDGLDGFIARRFGSTTRLGTLLDPIMDKFFAAVILGVFWWEDRITILECMALLSRDVAVVLYGLWLSLLGRLGSYRVRAIWCGKATTVLQFIVFIGLLYQFVIPIFIYYIFVGFGCLSLVELYYFDRENFLN